MRFRYFLAAIFPCLTGCAIHPLPGDVTGYNTIDIANHIRCEARDAIQRKAIDLLEKSPETGAHELAAKLKDNPEYFRKVGRKDLKGPDQRAFYDRYIQTGIAYDFTFDMTETNVARTNVDFVKALSGGTFSLEVNAANDRSRQNIRKFFIAETFQKLLANRELNCAGLSAAPNYAYPIAGSIGLGEVINTFIDLNETKTLTQKDGKGPVMAEELRFNTILSGSVIPKVVLTPAGSRFRLTEASLTAEASRTDKHQVLIGLSVPPLKEKKEAAVPRLAGIGIVGRSVLATRQSTPAEERAILAVTQFRVDFFYDRATSLIR